MSTHSERTMASESTQANAEATPQPREPLPCPFCGTAVLAEEDTDDLEADGSGVVWWISCKTCNETRPFDSVFFGDNSREAVVTRWNQRAGISSSPATPQREPYMWEVRGPDGTLHVYTRGMADCYSMQGRSVTPLYAGAPPEPQGRADPRQRAADAIGCGVEEVDDDRRLAAITAEVYEGRPATLGPLVFAATTGGRVGIFRAGDPSDETIANKGVGDTATEALDCMVRRLDGALRSAPDDRPTYEELAEALRPLAAPHLDLPDELPDSVLAFYSAAVGRSRPSELTFGAVRRARALLARFPQPSNDTET